MNTFSIDIKDKLENAEIGTFKATSGWAIYINMEPISPDTTITISDTSGFPPRYTLNNRNYMRIDGCQIRIRGGGYTSSWDKAIVVVNNLDRCGKYTAEDDTEYQDIIRTSGLLFVGIDEKARYIWSVNFVGYRNVTR